MLVPIDPLRDGINSKAAITTKTSGWEVRESIMYVDVHDSEWKQELELAGYHQLAESENNMDDVKHLGLENEQFIVMGRHELVDIVQPDYDDDGLPLSREYPWRSGMAMKKTEGFTRSTIAASTSGDSKLATSISLWE